MTDRQQTVDRLNALRVEFAAILAEQMRRGFMLDTDRQESERLALAIYETRRQLEYP